MLASDMIVFVTPLYWYSFPSSLKSAIDKFYSFIIGEKDCSVQEALLLACGEDTEERIFDGLQASYALILENRGWTDGGQLFVPGVGKKGDVLQTDFLEKAEQMGRAIQ